MLKSTDEKNVLLATKIMGWTLKGGMYWSKGQGFVDLKFLVFDPKNWNPLENIEQAMMLAYKMCTDGWDVGLVMDNGGAHGFRCICELRPETVIGKMYQEHEADTPATAICEAILQTIEERKDTK